MSSIYLNKSLRRGQIRTITLHAGTDSDPIHCTLDVVNLKAGPPYKALSYTWGPPGDTREITIDGIVVPIRENLYQALYHLRYPTTTRRLWIDAVCINQLNNAEKNSQVSQMSKIYAAAYEVLVWLG
ncbi:heterokaryon incompatibility protein-domain-containing protein, partial [Phaeosphaeriaceae sp. PMI808]